MDLIRLDASALMMFIRAFLAQPQWRQGMWRACSTPSESPSAKMNENVAGCPSAYVMECQRVQRYDMRDNSSDALHPIFDRTIIAQLLSTNITVELLCYAREDTATSRPRLSRSATKRSLGISDSVAEAGTWLS